MPDNPSDLAIRRSYHHGDLRQSLIDAGLTLAREGGPQAIVLREATRRAGVAPNAAYRHFANREALFEAVRAQVLATMAGAIAVEMQPARQLGDAAERSRAMLAAVGRSYLAFAQAETGWFRTAFARSDEGNVQQEAAALGPSADPFELLRESLDAMVQAGVLPAERRAMAEYLAWSTVHGMATLMIDGPLRHSPPGLRAQLTTRLLQMVEKGL
ncbi:TetR/AcrR family transcriptional regulator [Diaphorobacter aerolatus]|uniref:TetR/AcrR family transcriptional regulator n=1 Tax=Diaphorobacter aerolatus TaxID=1288495 RepID=A0A7H0GG52_9BURK|nr:TetR/AcrR family transcriptional regulator [Diaphorobacter aerolatus]QNP47268.1 TetR/AcrR family transcriptional regulator [Diaphorobacter aerolatus]